MTYCQRSEIIIKYASGTVLLLVDSVTGDLKIAGKAYQRATNVTEFPEKIFTVADDTGEIILFLNSSQFVDILIDINPYIPAGSLIIEGKVHHAISDERLDGVEICVTCGALVARTLL